MKSKASLPSLLLSGVIWLFIAQFASAGSATWNLNPTSGGWNTATNWTPNTVPNGASDIATFAVSNTTDVSLSSSVTVSGIVFNPGASAFTLDVGLGPVLTVQGGGFTNNSGTTQQIVLPVDAAGNLGSMQIFNSATAGTDTVFTVSGSFTGYLGGYINFWDTSAAGDATFMITGGVSGSSAVGGRVTFLNTSSAGNGTFICEGGGSGTGTAAVANFYDTSSAANATIVANGSDFSDGAGAQAFFSFSSTADNATLIANGTQGGFAAGTIYFASDATGGKPRIELSGTGNLNLTLLDLASLTIGSIEGNGQVFLGAKNLSIGSNNLNTTFSGVIQDGGSGGSLTKLGHGTFTLAGASSYTGGTSVNGGRLFVTNKSGSATGTGPVTVDAGTLGGTGRISGPVTIASSTSEANLAPGVGKKPATLTLLGPLTLGPGTTSPVNYRVDLDTSNHFRSDSVKAFGVTISGATVSFVDAHPGTPPPGTVFTLINNTATTPIAGAFANLQDGWTISINNINYLASYEGGDGNDLTLTVVP